MILDFPSLVAKHNIHIKGVIQVGAHFAEEYDTLRLMGVRFFVFVEPCKDAFNVLRDKFAKIKSDPNNNSIIAAFNRALADYEGEAEMFTETVNNGQSNSLLAPKKHLEQHPSIVFNARETVMVCTLDSLDMDYGFEFNTTHVLNTLIMDVQGAELMVLKGATNTIKQIDYIYTEVNRDEVYENCAQVEELDSFLIDFDRVETQWVGNWGDALYLRRKHVTPSHIVEIPDHFKPIDIRPYPEDNFVPFEYWLSLEMEKLKPIESDRIYLGVMWTAYYKHYSYGKDKIAIYTLQSFLDNLDKSKKYWTVVQYDDGILNDISKLHIKVFSMSKKYDYSLPLICQPHTPKYNLPKAYLFSFIGAFTHHIRSEIVNTFQISPFVYVSNFKIPKDAYMRILSQSWFSICPRGYGPNSFRIQESLECNSIPVIITDEYYEPHGIRLEDYGIRIHPNEISQLYSLLSAITRERINELQANGQEVYKKYFTFEANRDLILKNI